MASPLSRRGWMMMQAAGRREKFGGTGNRKLAKLTRKKD